MASTAASAWECLPSSGWPVVWRAAVLWTLWAGAAVSLGQLVLMIRGMPLGSAWLVAFVAAPACAAVLGWGSTPGFKPLVTYEAGGVLWALAWGVLAGFAHAPPLWTVGACLVAAALAWATAAPLARWILGGYFPWWLGGGVDERLWRPRPLPDWARELEPTQPQSPVVETDQSAWDRLGLAPGASAEMVEAAHQAAKAMLAARRASMSAQAYVEAATALARAVAAIQEARLSTPSVATEPDGLVLWSQAGTPQAREVAARVLLYQRPTALVGLRASHPGPVFMAVAAEAPTARSLWFPPMFPLGVRPRWARELAQSSDARVTSYLGEAEAAGQKAPGALLGVVAGLPIAGAMVLTNAQVAQIPAGLQLTSWLGGFVLIVALPAMSGSAAVIGTCLFGVLITGLTGFLVGALAGAAIGYQAIGSALGVLSAFALTFGPMRAEWATRKPCGQCGKQVASVELDKAGKCPACRPWGSSTRCLGCGTLVWGGKVVAGVCSTCTNKVKREGDTPVRCRGCGGAILGVSSLAGFCSVCANRRREDEDVGCVGCKRIFKRRNLVSGRCFSCQDKSPTSTVVASSERGIFHKPSCKWAQKISARNRLTYASSVAARAAGLTPCQVCGPR